MVNVMDEYVSYTEKCLHNYLKLIFVKKYNKDIATRYIDTYMMIRYSNYLDEASKKVSLSKKIGKALDDTNKKLISEYDRTTENLNLINSYRIFSSYFYNLDQVYLLESQKRTVEIITEQRTKLLDLEDATEFQNEFNKMVRDDIKKKKDFITAFDSKIFDLDIQELEENLYYAKLHYNITFPELYSESAIKKAREKDSISEDLTAISFLLISVKIANDLIDCDFDNKYIVDLPKSYFDKKTKIKALFGTIDSVYVQDRLRIAIDFATFTRYKSYVMDYIRNGFVFAVKLDESFDYSTDNVEYLELFDKIILETDKYYYKDMKKRGKIKDRIIAVDEVE